MKRFFIALAIFATGTSTINNTYASESYNTIEHTQQPNNRQDLDNKLDSYIVRMIIASNSGDNTEYQRVANELYAWTETLNNSDEAYVMGRISEFMRSINPNHDNVDTQAIDAKIEAFVNRGIQAQINSDQRAADQLSIDIAEWMQTLNDEEKLYASERFSAILSGQNQMRHNISQQVDISEAEIEDKIYDLYIRALYCTSDEEVEELLLEMNTWLKTLTLEDQLYANHFVQKLFFGDDYDKNLTEERKAEIKSMTEDFFNEIMKATAMGDQAKIDQINARFRAKTETFTEAEACYLMEIIEELASDMI